MTSTENRGLTVREAVLEYCTSWTQAAYIDCWQRSHEVAPVPTTEDKEDASLAVARELMVNLNGAEMIAPKTRQSGWICLATRPGDFR